MGNYTITIRGVGPHHNGQHFDAEQVAAKAVDALKAAGHSIIGAEMTYGGVEVIEDGLFGGVQRQVRSLLKLTPLAWFIFAAAILAPLRALAQTAQWAADQVAGPVIVSEPTLAGQLLSWVAVAALSVVTLLMGLAGAAMARRAKDSKIWATVNSLWVLAQTVVAHVEKELRPKVQKALEDGKLTPEEGAQLKAEALRLFKEAAGKNLLDLQKLLGLTEGAVGTFISGLLERAVSSIKPAPTAPKPIDPSALVKAAAEKPTPPSP